MNRFELISNLIWQVLSSVISHVRFLAMTPQEFATRLADSGVLTQEENLAIFLKISGNDKSPMPAHLSPLPARRCPSPFNGSTRSTSPAPNAFLPGNYPGSASFQLATRYKSNITEIWLTWLTCFSIISATNWVCPRACSIATGSWTAKCRFQVTAHCTAPSVWLSTKTSTSGASSSALRQGNFNDFHLNDSIQFNPFQLFFFNFFKIVTSTTAITLRCSSSKWATGKEIGWFSKTGVERRRDTPLWRSFSASRSPYEPSASTASALFLKEMDFIRWHAPLRQSTPAASTSISSRKQSWHRIIKTTSRTDWSAALFSLFKNSSQLKKSSIFIFFWILPFF